MTMMIHNDIRMVTLLPMARRCPSQQQTTTIMHYRQQIPTTQHNCCIQHPRINNARIIITPTTQIILTPPKIVLWRDLLHNYYNPITQKVTLGVGTTMMKMTTMAMPILMTLITSTRISVGNTNHNYNHNICPSTVSYVMIDAIPSPKSIWNQFNYVNERDAMPSIIWDVFAKAKKAEEETPMVLQPYLKNILTRLIMSGRALHAAKRMWWLYSRST
jgi:hypothetical protein